MSTIREHTCAEPGPRSAHCTDRPAHDYSCYDAGEDVSWNYRQDAEWTHECSDPRCTLSPEHCPPSERVDGKRHSWRFEGDDPHVVCHYCGEIRDAITGRVIRPRSGDSR